MFTAILTDRVYINLIRSASLLFLTKTAILLLLFMIALLLVGCGDGAPDMGEASTSPVAEETDATTASTPDSTPEPTQAADDEAEEASGPDADPPQDDNYSPEEFFFVVGGVEVIMGQPALPIIDRLGEYQNSFCA